MPGNCWGTFQVLGDLCPIDFRRPHGQSNGALPLFHLTIEGPPLFVFGEEKRFSLCWLLSFVLWGHRGDTRGGIEGEVGTRLKDKVWNVLESDRLQES